MSKALNYAISQRKSSKPVSDNEEVELDKNIVENTIRPKEIGKKNWSFMRSKQSGY